MLALKYRQDVILTADSVVFCEDKIYNKPLDEAPAVSYLEHLGGRWHFVFTGVTVRQGSDIFSAHEETKLLFHKLTPDQIDKFHRYYLCV